MNTNNSRSALGDQQLSFSPDNRPAAEIAGEPVDIDIVAATYRSIVDQGAFEEMVSNWEAKLDIAEKARHRTPTISGQLFTQLIAARNTLEKLDIPAENDPLKRAVSEVPGPAVVISPDGRVAAVNVEGERAFGTRQGAFLDRAVIDPCSVADYGALMRAAGSVGNIAQAILTIVPKSDDDQPVDPFIAEAFLLKAPGQTAAFVAIRSLEIAWTPDASQRLQQAFALSSAEVDVARQFFASRNVDRIATERGVSRLTVRTQIKAIMAKTGSPTNVDLMRLLAMIGNRAQIDERGQVPAWHDPLGREKQIEVEEGRVIAWTWMGAENGTPVVLLRGLPMTYLLPGDGEERLRAAGIKLYVLSRPGYGNSTINARLSVLDDNLVALRHFLDHEIAGPCLGVGLASGSVPLIAEQQLNPARFHSLLVVGFVAGMDPRGIARLPMIQRTMLRLVTSAPWVVEMMAKTGHRMMRQHGVDWYLERAYRNTPRNLQTLRSPERAALIRNACEHLLKQGHVSFVRELQLVRETIVEAVEKLGVPLRYLAPTEDAAIDFDVLRQIERRNPHITIEAVPEADELVFYQQTNLIIDRIITAARGI